MQSSRWHIALGPGGALYIVVSGLILAAAVYTQANLLFWSFGLMVGGIVVSIGWSLVALRKLEVTRLLPGYTVAGQPATIQYRVRNCSRLPVFSLVIRERWRATRWWRRRAPIAGGALTGTPYGWLMHVAPGQSAQAEAPCWPTRRGSVRFESIEVSSAFPFGVVRRVVLLRQAGEVTVLPRLMRLERRLLNTTLVSQGMGQQRRDRAGGFGEFFGLREYRAGDPLRIIDWKRTARSGEMVAREMTQPSPPRIMIMLNLDEPSDDAADGPPAEQLEEDAIALTASLVCEAFLQGYRVGLAVTGPRCATFTPHHSLPHRAKLLEALTRLNLAERGYSPDPLPRNVSIVVHPGAGNALRGAGPARVLGAADLHHYVLGGPSVVSDPDRDVQEEMLNTGPTFGQRTRLGWMPPPSFDPRSTAPVRDEPDATEHIAAGTKAGAPR